MLDDLTDEETLPRRPELRMSDERMGTKEQRDGVFVELSDHALRRLPWKCHTVHFISGRPAPRCRAAASLETREARPACRRANQQEAGGSTSRVVAVFVVQGFAPAPKSCYIVRAIVTRYVFDVGLLHSFLRAGLLPAHSSPYDDHTRHQCRNSQPP